MTELKESATEAHMNSWCKLSLSMYSIAHILRMKDILSTFIATISCVHNNSTLEGMFSPASTRVPCENHTIIQTVLCASRLVMCRYKPGAYSRDTEKLWH